MKKLIAIAILGTSVAATLPAQARNVKMMLPISAALQSDIAKEKLDGSVKFFFGPQAHPQVVQPFATLEANSKETILDRQDLPSCYAALASALKQLQEDAKSVGANAVVNIVSYFKRGAPVASATQFECHAGSSSTYLTLKGDIVSIGDK